MLKAPARLFATAIFTVASAFIATSAANAASQAVCGPYADAAVKAALEVQQKDCGGHSGDGDGRLDLTNPQWSTKREDHLRWCLNANQDAVDHEKAQRAEKLATCTRCNDYSADALKAAKQVRDNACTYDLNHPQWSQNRGDHMRWCMAARPESVDGEKSSRAHRVMVCQDCADYVKLALAHAKENRDLKCGLKGARWDSTAEGHMNWCIGEENRRYSFANAVFWVAIPNEPSHTDDETNARAGAIAKCKQTKSAKQGLSQGVTTAVRSPKTEPKRTATGVEGVAKRGSSSSSVDSVNRSGTTRAGGSSSSAMDRLGGGGTAGASSGGGQSRGGSATRPSGGGSASSAAPSGALSSPNSGGGTTLMRSGGSAPGLGLR